MIRFFAPAVSLMNSLSYPRKMALIALVFSLSLLTFMYMLLSEINTDISFAEKERLGAEYNQVVMAFFQDIQQHRGMANAYLMGDMSFREKIIARQSDIGREIRDVDSVDNKYGKTLGTTEQWTAIKETWQGLSKQVFDMKAGESFYRHTLIINDTLSLMERVSDVSNLTLDPGDSFYLMDVAMNKLPLVTEYTGQIRGLGVGVLVPGKITTADKAELIVLSGLSKSTMKGVKNDMQKAFNRDPALRPFLESSLKAADAAVSSAMDVLKNRIVEPVNISMKPPEYFDIFSEAIDEIFTLHKSATSALNRVLRSRIDALKKKKFYIKIFAVLSFAVIMYLFAGIYLSVMDSLKRLVSATRRTGGGDLDVTVTLKTRDEMKLVADSFNDMTSRLSKAMRDLKRSNKDLKHFAHIASHDLKSPIVSLGSALKLFERRQGDRLDPEARQFISEAINGTIRMEKLISELLTYSRAGSEQRPLIPTDCSDVLAHTLSDLKAIIDSTGAEITAEHLPTVAGDPIQLGRLLQNLLGNAIKYSGGGPPRIRISAVQKGKEWEFSVSDNGVGVPPEYIEKIFEIFQRAHKDKYPGTGIGLATCKKIVERHGGRIWAESAPGKGSTFYFTLPVSE